MAEPKGPQKGDPGEDGIDYELEGNDAGDEKDDPTNQGYDEAAHSGESRYAIPSGEGGVFGTTGGGSPAEGFQVIDRPGVYDRSGEPENFDPEKTDRLPAADRHVQMNFEEEEKETDEEKK